MTRNAIGKKIFSVIQFSTWLTAQGIRSVSCNYLFNLFSFSTLNPATQKLKNKRLRPVSESDKYTFVVVEMCYVFSLIFRP